MYLKGINSITHKSQLVTNWARYKRHLIIISSLNKHYSLINHKLFNKLKYYINIVKQIANKLYAFNIRQFLLPAVIKY